MVLSDFNTYVVKSIVEADKPPATVRVVGAAWHAAMEELVLLDEAGTLSLWKFHEGKCLCTLKTIGGKMLGLHHLFEGSEVCDVTLVRTLSRGEGAHQGAEG